MGTKPLGDKYVSHRSDSSGVDQAGELSMTDFKKVLTSKESYAIPLTVSRGAAATVLANFSMPAMMREVLFGLKLQGLFRAPYVRTDTPLEGLVALFHEVTPATTRSATRKVLQRDQPECLPAEPATSSPTVLVPTVPRAAPDSPVTASSTLTQVQTAEHTQVNRDQVSTSGGEGSLQGGMNPIADQAAPELGELPVTNRDVPILTGRDRRPKKTPLVVETARLLQDATYIVGQQLRDAFLKTKILASGSADDDYVTDDDN